MPTVAQQFAHTLKEIGVKFVFGVPSGNMIDYIEALRQEEGIEFILAGHEASAAVMADVCGRFSGIPGVCFGTFGPGATNLSTGVGGALLDRSPLIAFTDEMPDHLLNRTVQMNIDHQLFFLAITKWTTRMKPENAEEMILKAAGIAMAEYPGSVHVGVPAGIGKMNTCSSENSVNYLRLAKEVIQNLEVDNTRQWSKLFREAKRPVIAAGLTAARTDPGELIRRIAEKFRIPVVLTPMAKGLLSENHPLYAGVLFHALSDRIAETHKEADLVIGIGYDAVELNYEDWMPDVPLIHFDTVAADVDEERIETVVNVVGELKTTLPELLQIECKAKNWDIDLLVSRKNMLFEKLTPEENSFGPLAIVEELRKSLPEDGILTVDVGAHLHLTGQKWLTPGAQKLIITNGWSSMGFAIPAAIAAKLCNPGLEVAALLGDGGFLMTAGELATAKRLNLKIVFVVIFDNSLSLIRIKQEKKNFDNRYGTELHTVYHEPAANYFGVPVIRAQTRNEFKNALEKAFAADGPALIEVFADGSEYDGLVLKPNR